MDGVCSTHGTDKEDLKGRDHLGGLGVDEMIILKTILSIKYDDLEWIRLVQDKNQLRALVNTVVELWVP
jgi:hypothetical protein